MPHGDREPGHRPLALLAEQYGMPASTLQRIAALIVLWGTFEGDLEKALWRFGGEDPSGKRPTTDKMQLSEKLARFRELAGGSEDTDWAEIVGLIYDVAANLKAYRDTIVHGRLLPASVGGGFVLNTAWYGEQRKRPGSVAHIDDRLVGIMLDGLHELMGVMAALAHGDRAPHIVARVLSRRDSLKKAKTNTGEIIHLTELMNSDTY
jgi:hypothetical protein